MDRHSLTISSAYADLVTEPVDGGGILLFIRQHTGGIGPGESLINLSPEQATELLQWLVLRQEAGK